MVKILLLCALILGSRFVHAQRTCGTTEYLNHCKAQNPSLAAQMDAINHKLHQLEATSHKNRQLITIPVVVHVLYQNAEQNISDQQIFSQIDVLNEDYRKLNANASTIPSAFSSIAADCEIQFCLAARSPEGLASNGITRTQTSVSAFSLNDAMKRSITGGVDAWPTDKYLNIWVCNLANNLLGFATLPGTVIPALDGVVIGYKFFGRNTPLGGNYNKGRTATHEIGHWLNLIHIWGDDDNASDPCGGSDQVSDTPNQEGSNFQCPSYPSPSCGNTSDMFMNFMDYTYDQCMNMFTLGQKTRMQNTINLQRNGLLTSNGCLGVPTAADCDTLNNITGGDGLVYYLMNEVLPDESGYLTGTNSLGHTAFADSFYTNETKIINGIRFDFAKASSLGFSTQITAAIWNSNGLPGPGNMLAQTTFSLNSVIANVENFTNTDVFFTEPPTVNGAYYAGFILTTLGGDTLAIHSNQFDEINTNTAWYMTSTGEWTAFSDTTLYGQALSLAIRPVQCIPLGTVQLEHTSSNLLVYPNPVSQSELTINHNLKKGVWQVISMAGKVLQVGEVNQEALLKLDVSALPPGMYLVKLDDGSVIKTGKFLKTEN
ncbi:MAG: M43 family zinc metalloprotease [Bacteroidia bacterium]